MENSQIAGNHNPSLSVRAGPYANPDQVEKCLDFLLGHFQAPVWPKTIATKKTAGAQTVVSSREEVLTHFKEADFQDCRISGFRYWRPSTVSEFVGIKNDIAPDLIMIDLDKANFKSIRSLKLALTSVLKSVEHKILGQPTVLWSGNGYHIYQPINALILENITDFNNIERPSTEFLRFAELYLSDGKSDPMHNNTVSLNNLMMRVPGSINSKNGQVVHLMYKWNGIRPNMNLLIGSFCAYMTDKRIREEQERAERIKKYTDFDINNKESYTIDWIERLLDTPLDDHRQFVVWMILPQYLMNCKKLSYDNARSVVEYWLDRCAQLKRLDRVHIKQKLKAGFQAADKGFRPISAEKMIVWKPELYSLLFP